jgi:hypothetical protein
VGGPQGLEKGSGRQIEFDYTQEKKVQEIQPLKGKTP